MFLDHRTGVGALAICFFVLLLPGDAAAQARGGRGRPAQSDQPSVTLSVEARAQIRSYYEARTPSGVEALPPGIRRNLARGKPLPPGIAKKVAPPELSARVQLPAGYELVEVGLDVFLVEVATHVIHDVLMDIVR
jgi:hypothetical protein